MIKFKKVSDAVMESDLYKFHQLINKYGQDILDKLIPLKEECDEDKLYFLLLSNLWYEKGSVLTHIPRFDDYIDYKIIEIKNSSKNLTLTNIKSFPSLTDENTDLTILKERRIYHLNELVINYILIKEFKIESGASNVKFEKVVPYVKRGLINGLFSKIGTSENPEHCFYVYLVTSEQIYVKPLTIKYTKVISMPSFIAYDLNSFTELKILTNESIENPLFRKYIAEFKDSKPLCMFAQNSIESAEVKEFITEEAKFKNIEITPIKE